MLRMKLMRQTVDHWQALCVLLLFDSLSLTHTRKHEPTMSDAVMLIAVSRFFASSFALLREVAVSHVCVLLSLMTSDMTAVKEVRSFHVLTSFTILSAHGKEKENLLWSRRKKDDEEEHQPNDTLCSQISFYSLFPSLIFCLFRSLIIM